MKASRIRSRLRFPLSTLLVATLLLLSEAFAATPEPKPLTEWIRSKLPEKLQSLEIGKTSKDEVETRLGKPGEISPESIFYYDLGGIQYDTAIKIGLGKVQSFSYSWSKSPGNLDSLEAIIPKERVREGIAESSKLLNSPRSHEASRVIFVRMPEENLTLVFSSAGRKNLRKVIIEEKASSEASSVTPTPRRSEPLKGANKSKQEESPR